MTVVRRLDLPAGIECGFNGFGVHAALGDGVLFLAGQQVIAAVNLAEPSLRWVHSQPPVTTTPLWSRETRVNGLKVWLGEGGVAFLPDVTDGAGTVGQVPLVLAAIPSEKVGTDPAALLMPELG